MKKMHKAFALILALVMVMGLATTAFADEPTYSITINKAEIGETYSAYKIFDVTYADDGDAYTYSITTGSPWYTIVSAYAADATHGLTLKDSNSGNPVIKVVTADAEKFKAADFAVYLAEKLAEANIETTLKATAVAGPDGKGAASITTDSAGYYFVTTTLGSLCSLNTASPNAIVDEKNTIPGTSKNITGVSEGMYASTGDDAIAALGSTVTYTADIRVAKGTDSYVYHDTMSGGLAFSGIVTVETSSASSTDRTVVDAANYTLKTTDLENGETFTVAFTDSFIASLSEGDYIYITYTATVTDGALHTDPATNSAYLTYGDSGKTTTTVTEVYNATIAVNKTDKNGAALSGAEFVLAVKVGDGYKYYKLDNNKVTWVEGVENADKHISGTDGIVPSFTGLANGTYILIETKAPDGYQIAPHTEIVIEGGLFTSANLNQTTTVINHAGQALPSTGGMGTTLFYVFGGLMVAAAIVLLVTKKRMAAQN